MHLGEGVGNTSTVHGHVHITRCWQYILPASCLHSIPLGVGREMAIWEWVPRTVAGDPTLRVTHDLKLANAPPRLENQPCQHLETAQEGCSRTLATLGLGTWRGVRAAGGGHLGREQRSPRAGTAGAEPEDHPATRSARAAPSGPPASRARSRGASSSPCRGRSGAWRGSSRPAAGHPVSPPLPGCCGGGGGGAAGRRGRSRAGAGAAGAALPPPRGGRGGGPGRGRRREAAEPSRGARPARQAGIELAASGRRWGRINTSRARGERGAARAVLRRAPAGRHRHRHRRGAAPPPARASGAEPRRAAGSAAGARASEPMSGGG